MAFGQLSAAADAPIPGIGEITQARVHIKEVAVKHLFRPARNIVEEELTNALHGKEHIPCNAFANPDVY